MLSNKKANKSLKLENVSFQLSIPSQTEVIMPSGVTGGLPRAVKLQRAGVNRFNFSKQNQTSLKMSTSLCIHPQVANCLRKFEP